MTSRPVYRTVLAVDMEQSSRRPNPVKETLRLETYRILQAAMHVAGVHACYCDPFVDRGDGVLILVRPVDEVPKTVLLHPLLPVLSGLLMDYNVSLPASQRSVCGLRLRAVIHSGEVHRDGNGPFGETLDVACRLLDSPRLKNCLKCIEEPLILVVSELRSAPELLGSGFVLEELTEPRATEEARRVDPRRYDKTHHQPLFLAVRLRRP